MDVVLATSNKGKVREIALYLPQFNVIPYSDLLEPFEIVEDGEDFKSNALIKARAVQNALNRDDVIILADDSGISVPTLGGEPGLFSARYAGSSASDLDNLNLLVKKLSQIGLKNSEAYYTCAIALKIGEVEYVTHGFMHGRVIDTPRGKNGFGYDPIFCPKGFDKTLGELDDDVKKSLSHRSKAIKRAGMVLKNFLSE